MTGRELYEVHRGIAEALSASRLREWEFLSWEEQDEWEARAVEQSERDREPEQHWENEGGALIDTEVE